MTTPEYHDEPLPYPTIKHRTRWSGCEWSEEYLIPEADRPKVFALLYPFLAPPKFDTRMIDIHEDREFIVRSFKVVREAGMNLLVSPYYYRSGGSVIDWMPVNQPASKDASAPGEYSVIGYKDTFVAQQIKPGSQDRLTGVDAPPARRLRIVDESRVEFLLQEEDRGRSEGLDPDPLRSLDRPRIASCKKLADQRRSSSQSPPLRLNCCAT